MIESKYNPFIVCFLHNCEEYLFSRDGHLLYPIPFGNYKVAEYFDNEKTRSFYKLLDDYINKYGLKIIEEKLINAYEYIHVYEYVFTFDKKYYKVNTRTIDGSIHGEIDNIPWIDHNLEDFEVHPKTITQTIYVSKND